MEKTPKGFTLVELAIVITVIGLLIGGILAATSMMGTARINGMVRQLSEYETATRNYITKYGFPPGDYSVASNGGGGKDGRIDHVDVYESAAFWADLSISEGLKNARGGNYQIWGTGVSPIELEAPRFDIEQFTGTGTDHFPSLLAAHNFSGTPQANMFVYQNYNSSSAAVYGVARSYDPLKSSTVLAFDKKIDDGKPETGLIVGISFSGNPNCKTGTNYNISAINTAQPIFACSLLIYWGVTNPLQ